MKNLIGIFPIFCHSGVTRGQDAVNQTLNALR
jgi:hypothetical protein